MVEITLDYRCSICGSNLRLLEKKRYIEILCPRCGIGLRESKKEIIASVRKGNRIEWKDAILKLVLDFYSSTPTILRIRGVSELNEGTHILKNVR